MPVVRLGHADGRVTTATVSDADTEQEQFYAITHQDGGNQGVWVSHSTDRSPAWLESNDSDFAEKLAAFYGCPVGAPEASGEVASK